MTISEIIVRYRAGMADDETDLDVVRKEATIALIPLVSAERFEYTSQKCWVCGYRSNHFLGVDGYQFPCCYNCRIADK